MTASTPAILPPPRLKGDPATDAFESNRYLFQLYYELVVNQKLGNRLDAIAALAPLPTNLTGTPTAAQLNAISAAVNAIIAAAKRG